MEIADRLSAELRRHQPGRARRLRRGEPGRKVEPSKGHHFPRRHRDRRRSAMAVNAVEPGSARGDLARREPDPALDPAAAVEEEEQSVPHSPPPHRRATTLAGASRASTRAHSSISASWKETERSMVNQ